MGIDQPSIDPYLFERQLEAFRTFVEEHSGVPFVSFSSNPYTEKHEGYKYEVHKAAREALTFQAWKEADIGSGEIAGAVIGAIEVPGNNLVPWQGRFGAEARPHQPLYEAKSQPDQLLRIEGCLFRLYRDQQEEKSFSDLTDIFGKSYPLLAYFFFLKDRSRYLPIAPTFFDRSFEHLGADFKTARRCSWENYSAYVGLIGELKEMLTESLSVEVTLLDAHSFAWILVSKMESENRLADVQEYLSLSASEREAIIKARIGQGRFRQHLIDYWAGCAVTGCRETALLHASHIKPWAKASMLERMNLYNGLLLSPAIDAAFDAGYISFDDEGLMLISERLAPDDAKALAIRPEMRLQRIESAHKKYLAFHREHIFK
jgi:predicted restriction endonuclease